MALLSDGNSRHSQTNSSRSAAVSLGLEEACRRKHVQLMPEHGDLGFQLRLRPQRCGQGVNQ
jgi:hypothetical protein